MSKKYIISESQAKKFLIESTLFDSVFKQIISFLSDNYEQGVIQESDGLEFVNKPVVTKTVDGETISLDEVLDYLEYKFKTISKEFLKQCLIDWYNGFAQNNKRLSKNVPIFESLKKKVQFELINESTINNKTYYHGRSKRSPYNNSGYIYITDSFGYASGYSDGKELFAYKIPFSEDKIFSIKNKEHLKLIQSLVQKEAIESIINASGLDNEIDWATINYIQNDEFEEPEELLESLGFYGVYLKERQGINSIYVFNEKELNFLGTIDLTKKDSIDKINQFYKENEFLNTSHMLVHESEQKTYSGNYVNQHIINITPDTNDIPDYFMNNLIKHRNFIIKDVDLNELLKTDNSFKEYYESAEDRYEDQDIPYDELYQELVIVDGELLDGYNRASSLLRSGNEKATAFVAIA